MNKNFELELCRDCVTALIAGNNPAPWIGRKLTLTGEVYYFDWKDCDGCAAPRGGLRLPAVTVEA